MVSRLLKFLNRDIVTMNQAALVLAVFSVLSQLFGLLRDRLLASLVGPSASLDVYYAAFRIPDFVYNSFACLLSVTVLVPFITAYMNRQDADSALRKFLNSVFTVYMMGMALISLILIIWMPALTKLIAPGFSAAQQADLVLFSRIMLVSPFSFGLSSLLSSFAQVQRKFFSFAIAPLFYNLGILLGVIALRPFLGMLGVVLGVVFGALLYVLIQFPTLASIGKLPRFTRDIDWDMMKKVMATSLPRTLGLSLTNLSFIIIGAIASLLAVGSLSVFQLSYNIENTPLMVFGVSYAVAAFPMLSKFFSEKNMTSFMEAFYRATRNLFFFTVPIALLMIVLRAHIVRILLGAGVFSWNDTRLVAASVALFCISITAQSMVLLLVRGFFAVGDTKTPLYSNILAVGITALAAIGLVDMYQNMLFFRNFMDSLLRIEGVVGGAVVLLPLAFSIGQTVNAYVLWFFFHKKYHPARIEDIRLFKVLSHMVAAGIIAAAAAYYTLVLLGTSVDQTQLMGILLQGALASVVGFGVYGAVLYILRNEDIVLIIQTARSKFWKEKPITEQQQDL